jgi:hypothetical protein
VATREKVVGRQLKCHLQSMSGESVKEQRPHNHRRRTRGQIDGWHRWQEADISEALQVKGAILTTRDIALANEILRGVVGSTAHGTAIEGQDDRDEMGVFVEPPANVCGLTSCDHYIYRDKPEGVRSEAGDLDLTLYSLRKFCRLAAQGNPSVVILLWLPEHMTKTTLGAEFRCARRSLAEVPAPDFSATSWRKNSR